MARERKVLVVDDDPDVLGMLAEAIAMLGCDVLLAQTGGDALELVRRERPSVVLTDLRMPALDGLTLAKAVREVNPRTEVLIVTAHADLGSAIEAIRRGAFDYLEKPVDLEKLRERVRQALDRHELVAGKETLLEELKRANDTLRAAQSELVEKARLAMLAEVSVGLHHSILNPIAGILGALHVLRDECAPQVKAEALAQAELEADRIQQIIRRLPWLRRTPVARYVGETSMLDLDRAIEGDEKG